MAGARGLALALALALSSGCAHKEQVDITAPITGESGTNAEKGYRRGLQEKKDSNFIEATRYLEWVRNNFPYSQYASLAELALADMTFERDDFPTAAAAYLDFVKGHPSHAKADYAAFRVGLSWFEGRPDEWFLVPPGHEKDQTNVRQALDALQKFTLQYPKSEMLPEARRLMDESRSRLAAHERYVAGFYVKKGQWKGAAGRWLTLADQFGDLDQGRVRDEGLWGASEAFAKLEAVEEEASALTRFIEETQDQARKAKAQERLAALAARMPKKEEPKKDDGAKVEEKAP
jgi:outer membrane protein assembly factor BamD